MCFHSKATQRAFGSFSTPCLRWPCWQRGCCRGLSRGRGEDSDAVADGRWQPRAPRRRPLRPRVPVRHPEDRRHWGPLPRPPGAADRGLARQGRQDERLRLHGFGPFREPRRALLRRHSGGRGAPLRRVPGRVLKPPRGAQDPDAARRAGASPGGRPPRLGGRDRAAAARGPRGDRRGHRPGRVGARGAREDRRPPRPARAVLRGPRLRRARHVVRRRVLPPLLGAEGLDGQPRAPRRPVACHLRDARGHPGDGGDQPDRRREDEGAGGGGRRPRELPRCPRAHCRAAGGGGRPAGSHARPRAAGPPDGAAVWGHAGRLRAREWGPWLVARPR
mmetsp:Transcript_27217/g.64514  ORF Transcript_27217/g.64514 Transcript_27217/m.64514 type:complete len:333 (+) Transcript_27217:721-1719(+)